MVTYRDRGSDQGAKGNKQQRPPEVEPEVDAEEAGGEAAQVARRREPEQEHDGLVVPGPELGIAVLGPLARDGVRLDAQLLVHLGLQVP